MEKLQPLITITELVQSDGAPTGNTIIDALIAWIKDNRSNLVTDAARDLGIPQRLLSDTINFFVGVSAQEMILRLRMKQLMLMLDDPAISNEDAARQCHFASQKTVEGLMNRYYQTTLRAYRKGSARRDFSKSVKENQTMNLNAQKLH